MIVGYYVSWEGAEYGNSNDKQENILPLNPGSRVYGSASAKNTKKITKPVLLHYNIIFEFGGALCRGTLNKRNILNLKAQQVTCRLLYFDEYTGMENTETKGACDNRTDSQQANHSINITGKNESAADNCIPVITKLLEKRSQKAAHA